MTSISSSPPSARWVKVSAMRHHDRHRGLGGFPVGAAQADLEQLAAARRGSKACRVVTPDERSEIRGHSPHPLSHSSSNRSNSAGASGPAAANLTNVPPIPASLDTDRLWAKRSHSQDWPEARADQTIPAIAHPGIAARQFRRRTSRAASSSMPISVFASSRWVTRSPRCISHRIRSSTVSYYVPEWAGNFFCRCGSGLGKSRLPPSLESRSLLHAGMAIS